VGTGPDIIAAVENGEAGLARHRHELWLLGLRAALVRAAAARVCRRSRWQARRARRLLDQRVLCGIASPVAPRRRRSRRRSRARLVVV